MMDWMQFLEEVAIDSVMTPDQRRAFLARFDPLNASKTDKWIAENVKDERGDRAFAGEPAFKKLMTAVYRAVQREMFPELEQVAKGKKEKLEAFLRESWRKAPQPPILGVPSQENKEDEDAVQSPPELGDLGGENVGRSTTGLKPGAPLPRVRLPDNFVGRSDALSSVKEKLLLESEQTLVVSAIAGLGGLGKSVLATAIVLDAEVQARFEDGILWVTLGQNPDLQSCLGDWIRVLDKSRDSFSATTLESASGYLHNLLAERRMLLVVDDVWNAAHAEWFQVGGLGCRVLVTTREARIEGAEVYPLALMTAGEAIDLVRRKLGRLWKAADEAEVRSFAKVLGYLPLALDLAANQVRDGLSWGELRAEFEVERRAVALEVLDSSEAWERLSEEEQRRYSLRACFNLSLKRLSPEQLERFAWLGVLPEDVDLSGTIAEVLWDVRSVQAKKGLVDLRNRSFLTDGVATVEGVAIYRVHDLMHDTARGLIEKGELGIENLEMAHGVFLERYRGRSDNRSWYELPNDGYIHRHLTWHLEMAGQLDEIHKLMASGEDQNDWFEACDKIGQPGIFVEDVRRGWRLAEELYERDRGRAIVLQCRYALITGTLNTIANYLPINLILKLVKGDFWKIEQAWTYIEQIQDENTIGHAIETLSPYFSNFFLRRAIEKVTLFQNEEQRKDILQHLTNPRKTLHNILEENALPTVLFNMDSIRKSARDDKSDFSIITIEKMIEDQNIDTLKVVKLIKRKNANFSRLIEVVEKIKDESERAIILSEMSGMRGANFIRLLRAARTIKDEYQFTTVLISLPEMRDADFYLLLDSIRNLQDIGNRTPILNLLVEMDGADIIQLLNIAKEINDRKDQITFLSLLSEFDVEYFHKSINLLKKVDDENFKSNILMMLFKYNKEFSHFISNELNSILNNDKKAEVLMELVRFDKYFINKAIQIIRLIEDKSLKTQFLIELAKNDSVYLDEAIESFIYLLENGYTPVYSLHDLSKINSFRVSELFNFSFDEIFKTAHLSQNDHFRASILTSLAAIDRICFNDALEAVRLIKEPTIRLIFLRKLLSLDITLFDEARKAIEEMNSIYYPYSVILWHQQQLMKVNGYDFLSYLVEIESWSSELMDENYLIDVLIGLVGCIPMELLPRIYNKINKLMNNPSYAAVISVYLSRLPLDRLPYPDWQSHLHLLAHRTRADLMGDLATLYPAILHLGGEDAGRGMVGEMGRVCRQWK